MSRTLIIFIIFLTSCSEPDKKFDRKVWTEIDGNNFQQRKPLVTDLIQNHLHQGMNYEAILELLGDPEIYDDPRLDGEVKHNRIGYYLNVDYGWSIDPVEGTDLIIQLSKDSTLVDVNVVDWEK